MMNNDQLHAWNTAIKTLADLSDDNRILRSACQAALDWMDRWEADGRISFDGEAELAEQLRNALNHNQNQANRQQRATRS